MSMLADLLVAFTGGMVLAAVFSALLWHAVRGLARRDRPGVVLLAGGALRVALVIAGIGLVTRFQPAETAAALCGFVAVRVIACAWLGRRRDASHVHQRSP